MRKENKEHGVALLYTPCELVHKKEQSQQAEGTRWRGAHFSVCDIILGNHSLRSSLCVFLLSFSGQQSSGTDVFLLLLSSRLPFVVVDKKQQSTERKGESERASEREREREIWTKRHRKNETSTGIRSTL